MSLTALAPDRVPEVKGTATLDHDRVVEELVPATQPCEVGNPFAEQHGHEADAHLVNQSEPERLLKERLDQLPKRGCVHSFTGTLEEMQA